MASNGIPRIELLAAVVVLAVLVGLPAGIYSYQFVYLTSQHPEEITINASQWTFNPSTITVKIGSKVTLKITSLDVEHGFAIEGLGVYILVKPGAYVYVTLTPDRVGVFRLECYVICGTGHWHMEGAIIVID